MDHNQTTSQPRILTPSELGITVATLRNMLQWSQETLAALSRLSVRTVQRVESGSPSGTDTRRALASAFGYEDIDFFNKPYNWPTDEEIQAQKEKFEKENIILDATTLKDGQELANLAEQSIGDCSVSVIELKDEDEYRFASLIDSMREYRDCYELYTKVQKPSAYEDFQEHLDLLATAGISLCYAMRKTKIVGNNLIDENGLSCKILYILACHKGREPKQFCVSRSLN